MRRLQFSAIRLTGFRWIAGSGHERRDFMTSEAGYDWAGCAKAPWFHAQRDRVESSGKVRMPQWQPIETAPKDGTTILLYWPHYPEETSGVVWLGAWKINDRLARAYFSDTCEWDDYEMAEPRHAPTHWMPLPPPPDETEPPHLTIYDPDEKRDLRINLKAPPTGDMP